MTCIGVVRDKRVEPVDEVTLPEGARVRVIPEARVEEGAPKSPPSLGEWLKQARDLRSRMPMTSDSVEILREIREERANR
jgi:hypothetical protein